MEMSDKSDQVSSSNSEYLTALFHEYNALVAENRLALGGTDRKLAIALAAAAAFLGAGAWKSSPEIFLLVPFVVLFLGFFALAELAQIVLLGAHLAILEERINRHIGRNTLTYFSRTVPAVYDTARWIDPITSKSYVSFNTYYSASSVAALLGLFIYTVYRGLPALRMAGLLPAIAYFALLISCISIFGLLGARAASSKLRLMALIKALGERTGEPGEQGAPADCEQPGGCHNR